MCDEAIDISTCRIFETGSEWGFYSQRGSRRGRSSTGRHIRTHGMQPFQRRLCSHWVLKNIQNHETSQGLHGLWGSSISRSTCSSWTILMDFGNSFTYFNHFIKPINQATCHAKFLQQFMTQGAALLCGNNIPGINFATPILHGKEFQMSQVNAIVVVEERQNRQTKE